MYSGRSPQGHWVFPVVGFVPFAIIILLLLLSTVLLGYYDMRLGQEGKYYTPVI